MDTLVSQDWLAAHLNDPGVIIFDASLPPVGVSPAPDTHARFLAEHIPGARFFDIEALSDATSGLPHTLPSAASFAAAMSALGVADTSTIVIYEQAGVFSAPRAWWMLRTFGAPRVHLLSGDLAAWLAAGHPVEAGEPATVPATFHATLNSQAVHILPQLKQTLAAHGQVLDARSATRFAGTAPEPRPGLRSGHMPGATSVPFTALVQEGRMKSPEALRAEFAQRGVALDQPITTTCGSGITAAVVALGLTLSGAESVALYDGSWAEYAAQPDAEIVTD